MGLKREKAGTCEGRERELRLLEVQKVLHCGVGVAVCSETKNNIIRRDHVHGRRFELFSSLHTRSNITKQRRQQCMRRD